MNNDNFFNFWGNDWVAFGFIVILVIVVANWRVYEKAGKPGWASIIPFYNTIVLMEIVGKPILWFFLITFVPFANIIFGVWALNLLSKSFGKNAWFTVGLIFLPFIFYPILGFGNAEYKSPAGIQNNEAV
jgi:hypothetical protein